MKKPVSALMLLLFLVLQIILTKLPTSHQVQGTSWMTVTTEPGVLLQRPGQWYLVSPQQVYTLHATGVQITASGAPVHWMEVPEPSGQGIWRLALSPANVPLVGMGGIYPAPTGNQVLWLDPGSRMLYQSQPGSTAMSVLSPQLSAVQRVLWSPDGQAVAVYGTGPQGTGVYLWDRDQNILPVALPNQSATVTGLGFSRQQTVLAAFSNGQVIWQGHGVLPLPTLSSITLDSRRAELVGLTATQVIWWRPGKTEAFSRQDLKWNGPARFAANGQSFAVVGQTMNGNWHLVVYHHHHALQISLPYPESGPYYLDGFLGNHWILVTIPDGAHRGTYAWWVSGD
ncbi:hypothetical protein TPY_3572 [Sulfobacillus acidophilus TPY]|uniref:WD40 repeat domain-containing protein n=1 Tax=Sulfobacillus acidophilus (strain ATCC 700253 / DSM 10332 / NAL) TaxID=679936 RepID=G8TWE5_SULAD|nr:hypothetical protein TPY_3572 [Sulfobacillus acidophilus TPY]AEW04843.1 hypothetical protein Sulac_1346 [Sulfobacillus acidophilus DSM 10332]